MDQIINELSISTTYLDNATAIAGMHKLLLASKKLFDIGFSQKIQISMKFSETEISPNYKVVEWSVDKNPGIDKDLRLRFLVYATKPPYIEDSLKEIEPTDIAVEHQFNKKNALGLGLASCHKIPVLSFDRDAVFVDKHVAIDQISYFEDGSNKTISDQVLSISSESFAEQNRHIFINRLRQSIRKGKEVVEFQKKLMPFLSFAKNAIEQLTDITGSENYFSDIVRHLCVLNDTMENWQNGLFRPGGVNCSPESESTMQRYSKCRTFECSDGIERVFEFHTKNISANKRIYYFAIPTDKIVHIGYVGDHLPTTNFPT